MPNSNMPDYLDQFSDDEDESGELVSEGASDWIEEGQGVAVQCLLCKLSFATTRLALEHCSSAHNFDFSHFCKELNLDFYDSIRLVNYIRSEVALGKQPVLERECWASDEFLKPILPDDPMLYRGEFPDSDQDAKVNGAADPNLKMHELEEEVRVLKEQLLASKTPAGESVYETNGTVLEGEEKPDNDSYYFQSYAWNEIHETMLKDAIRTDSYRDFIYKNKAIFKDKVVLDVGCGTGILSLFCARAGARQVFAVDNSDIIDKARAIVFENDEQNVISCIRGKIEEVDLPVESVDIIVSEWMGYGLLYEAMLDSVLIARDRFLRPGGLMVPSECRLLICAVNDPDYIYDRVHFWDNIYGFKMQTMKGGIYDDVVVECLYKESISSAPKVFKTLNLHTMSSSDANFIGAFQLHTDHRGALDAFSIYFDTFFMTSPDVVVPKEMRAEQYRGQGIAFTTGAFWKETHWKQSNLLLRGHAEHFEPNTPITGTVEYRKRVDNPRELEIEVEWAIESIADATQSVKHKQMFLMR